MERDDYRVLADAFRTGRTLTIDQLRYLRLLASDHRNYRLEREVGDAMRRTSTALERSTPDPTCCAGSPTTRRSP